MVNCKGVGSSPESPVVNQEICRYCRTRVCEECFQAATATNSKFQSEPVVLARHQHACIACTRFHPEVKELRSPPRQRRPSQLPRLNSAPISGGPRIDSLANLARDRRARPSSAKPSAGFLTVDGPPQVSRQDLDLSTVDLRRRRNNSAIAPTSRSCDFTRPARGLTARQLLRANATDLQTGRRQGNATELQTVRRHERDAPTSFSCDFTGPTSTEPKPQELSMVDLRDGPQSKSCDLTGNTKPIFDMSDEPTELELSTVDLRLPKYKVDVPTPTKRGRRSSAADPINSALTPISYEHLAAIDAKLSSVELEMKRYDAKKQQKQRKAPSSVASGGSDSSSASKKTVGFHLSNADQRPQPRQRRHTTTDTLAQRATSLNHGDQELAEEEDRQGKQSVEPIDFHLSTFDLKPRRHTTDAKPEVNQQEAEHHQPRSKKLDKKTRAMPATPEVTAPKYSKDEPCDLGYLDNLRLYTV